MFNNLIIFKKTPFLSSKIEQIPLEDARKNMELITCCPKICTDHRKECRISGKNTSALLKLAYFPSV